MFQQVLSKLLRELIPSFLDFALSVRLAGFSVLLRYLQLYSLQSLTSSLRLFAFGLSIFSLVLLGRILGLL